jgi:hypothetical protein
MPVDQDEIRAAQRVRYVGLSQLKKQKLKAAGSSGAVQALRMENDAPVVGPDAPTTNSKMVKLEIDPIRMANRRQAGRERPVRVTSQWCVIQDE